MDYTNFFKNVVANIKNLGNEPLKTPKADYPGVGSFNPIFAYNYNGEKNLGEIGPIRNYRLDYALLRMRSWQSFHESEITQTIMNRFNMWVVGKGLKLQCEPVTNILESEGIKIDTEVFNQLVEDRFSVWSKSKTSDYSGMKNVHFIAATAFKNAMISGDVLVVMRYSEKGLNVQLIDGAHVQSPVYGTEFFPDKLENGNRIINGIEVTPQGEHVRYFVRQQDFSIKTIEAKGKNSGLQMAFMVYGLEYRLDNNRGVPLFAVVLETLKKLERYKEATVGSAEERQKIVMQITHGVASTGENVQNKNLAKAHDWQANINSDLPKDINGNELANTVAVTTNKQVFNMPIDSELKSLESKNELYFKDFYNTNFRIICGALGIPPEVASSVFENNYSSSRAAIKDWEHTLIVKRHDFGFQFYQPIFDFWFECEILTNKIQAPGYLEARIKGNEMVLSSYRTARFVGAPVPHIDPLKEVKAIREKLGLTGYTIPLTTTEEAIESLGGGDADHIMNQYAKELEKSKKLKIIEEQQTITPPMPAGA